MTVMTMPCATTLQAHFHALATLVGLEMELVVKVHQQHRLSSTIFRPKFAFEIHYHLNRNFSFSDVDECTLNLDDCHVQAMCNNTPGSFSCSCNIGWTGNGSICEGTSKKLIVAKISLLNFAYAIDSNIKGNSFTSDIDECTLNLHDCDEQALCNNTPGSFSCSCYTGWTGNGTICEGTPKKLIVKKIFLLNLLIQ